MESKQTEAKEVLQFYADFTDLEALDMSYTQRPNDQRQRALRQVKLSEISFGKENKSEFMDINLSMQAVSYVHRHISPIVEMKDNGQMKDSNKLMLGLVFMKIFFPDKDTYVYLPIVMADISSHKKEMLNSSKNGIDYHLRLNLEDKIILNEGVLSYFFDFKTEEGRKDNEEFIAEYISDLITEISIGPQMIMNRLYNFFQKHLTNPHGLEILLPQANTNASGVCMFFNMKDQFKAKNLFLDLIDTKNVLIDEYLTYTQPENKAPKMSDNYWIGSMTKDFPLGHGQGIVMLENQENINMIPVVGGPGTGKTTLFLSLIANEITKRAISIIENDMDYNNLMLISSTANKAVANVYQSLNAFGFCYVGGNTENKANSIKNVREVIKKLNVEEFNKDTYEKTAKSLKKILKSFEQKKLDFKELKTLKDVKNYNELVSKIDELRQPLKDFTPEDELKIITSYEKLNSKISTVSGESFSIEKLGTWIEEIELTKAKLEKLGFISKMMKEKKILFDLQETIRIKEMHKEDVYVLLDLLLELEKKVPFYNIAINNLELREEVKELEDIRDQYENKPAKFLKLLKAESFGEFFRTNMYSLNYKVFLIANKFMYQHTLKNKKEVIKALTYLTYSDFKDRFTYLKETYDYISSSKVKMDNFFRHLSMVFPVTTSTLAAVGGMWAGFNRAETIYRTILADESGMITSKDIVPAMTQATRAIIVGDPKQLKPIVAINEIFLDYFQSQYLKEFWDKYAPSSVSAFHRSAGTIEGGFRATGSGIILDEHRRCVRPIANLFIEIADYQDLKVCTLEPKYEAYKKLNGNTFFFNVSNPNGGKTNYEEINGITKILNRLESIGFDLTTQVGIITPYVAQEAALVNTFGERLAHSPEAAKVGTVHKFQGVEYDVVIFSSVVSKKEDSLAFINQDPSMINVAISRAKHAFMVIGDYEKLTEEDSFTKTLAERIKEKGSFSDLSKTKG